MLDQQHEEHLGAPTDGPEPESRSTDAEGWECSSDLWLFRTAGAQGTGLASLSVRGYD